MLQTPGTDGTKDLCGTTTTALEPGKVEQDGAGETGEARTHRALWVSVPTALRVWTYQRISVELWVSSPMLALTVPKLDQIKPHSSVSLSSST